MDILSTKTITLLGRTYSLPDILRMLTILCGYILLRPYILKLSAKFQEKDHAREIEPDEESSHAATSGRRRIAQDEESDDEDGGDGGWGAGLRKEQRVRRREVRRRMEEGEESDESIEEFLVKE
ncbi:hypothetical protein RUND412_010165 [Rhizina undulata]